MNKIFDSLTIVGLITGFCAIFLGQLFEGGDFTTLLNLPAFIIVLGGTLGAVMIQTPYATLKLAFKILPWVFMPPSLPFDEYKDYMIGLAKKARQSGLFSLEEDLEKETNPIIYKGLEMLVIGIEKKALRELLEKEVSRIESKNMRAAHVFDSMGGYSPTIGILGAVLGLIHVMRNLSDPSMLGPGIAVAFVATIYGVGFANLIFIPVASKLKSYIARQDYFYEMIIEAFIGIANGENPTVLNMKLSSFGRKSEYEASKK